MPGDNKAISLKSSINTFLINNKSVEVTFKIKEK